MGFRHLPTITNQEVEEPLPTLVEIEAARGLRIAGEALRVRFTVHGIDDATKSLLMAQIRGIARKGFKPTMGRNVEATHVVQCEDSFLVSMYANKSVLPASIFSSGSTSDWVSRVRQGVERTRRAVDDLAKSQAPSCLVLADWGPGDDLVLIDPPLKPDAPDSGLRTQIDRLRQQERSLAVRRKATLIMGAIFLSAGVALMLGVGSLLGFDDYIGRVAGVGVVVYSSPLILMSGFLSSRQQTIRDQTAEALAHLDLRDLLSVEERRAHKLFQINSLELQRYYDQALQQRAIVFLVGVGCIALGFAAVGATFVFLYRHPDSTTPQKVVIASLGTASAILANFIAVIFLRMFTTIVRSMTEFHTRLVNTHHVHFANILAAKIQDDSLRNTTLADMARGVAASNMVPAVATPTEPSAGAR